jgi:eukaryotic-like serine/threonine-protein kinase
LFTLGDLLFVGGAQICSLSPLVYVLCSSVQKKPGALLQKNDFAGKEIFARRNDCELWLGCKISSPSGTPVPHARGELMPTVVAPDPLAHPTERLKEPPALFSPSDLSQVAGSYQDFRRTADGDLEVWSQAFAGDSGSVDLFRALHQKNPASALQLAAAATRLPMAGDEFAGFRLIRELGRGAFARVFLAEQIELADRQVVLKVTLDARTEVRALARLLHTNIVPIYSVHRSGLYQAVCMPYCGSMTLAEAIRRFRGETLPESGRGLVTLLHSSGQPSNPASGGDSTISTPSSDGLTAHQPSSTAVLSLLGGLSYVDAILWLGARLADGLAHAHDRGVLHRDLKPANVLLTDDGQPMLLDFNLSADTTLDGLAEAARVGGTLPYMAPEQLESYGGRPRVVDSRSDVYSLGVILYELLTGRHPFPVYRRATPEHLGRMVVDRQAVPRPRDRNPAVSVAVESIVCTCLDPDPDQRYSSARDLQEDLERQLNNQPLRHAADSDWGERLRKWARRHPRLSSGFTLGSCAAVLLGLAVGVALYQRERRFGLEARETRAAFLADSQRFQLSLTGLADEDDRRPLSEAVMAGRQAIGRYPAPDDPSWAESRTVRHLSTEDREQLRQEIGASLLMLAHATAKSADNSTTLGEALRLNHQAAGCFHADGVPGTVWSQRAEFLRRLRRDDEALAARDAAARTKPHGSRELYLAGWDLARRGEYAAAVPLLKDATREDPRSLCAWFLLGRCHDGLGSDADAIACYGTSLALQPDAHQVWYNRGLAQLRRGSFAEARADFDRAIELNDGVSDAYFNRALSRKALGDFAGAEVDCTRALKMGTARIRIYFVRAEVRDKLGKPEEAASDQREGLSREPVEESDWTARGYQKLRARPADPKGALADFNQALDRNPQYRPALVNKAHVLAEILGRPAEAASVLGTALQFHPDQASLRAARAVYLARAGRRTEAHTEAEAALRLSSDPATRYQVAGVYALTSKTNPEDRPEAFRLLTSALAKGYGFEHVDNDPELAPVRPLKEFQDLVSAANALRPSRK